MTMSGRKRNADLDRAISEWREEQIPPDTLEASSRRVWQRVRSAAEDASGAAGQETARGCAEMRAALPALRRGELPPARKLIVEAHLRECASCRAHEAGLPDPVATAAAWREAPAPRGAGRGFPRYGWAVAAVALLAAAAWVAGNRYFAEPAGSRAQIVSITGQAYRLSAASEGPLKPGDEVPQGVLIRTAGDSQAMVRLLDGSRVEMNQHTQFAVTAGFRNTTIHLDQGDIIVQAPKRRIGRLYVKAPDCTVSDTGTIFAVESGTKGSRVGVIEGTVSVAHAGKDSVLHAGESVATSQGVRPMSVSQQINWSKDRERYLALLEEFSHLRRKFQQIPAPAPRYQSRILPLVPANTILYVSFPNPGDTLAQANRIFHEELGKSEVLRNWWNGISSSDQQPSLDELVGEIQATSHYLGDEVVLVASPGVPRSKRAPVLLAQVRRPGLENFLRRRVAVSLSKGQAKPAMHVVDDKSFASLPRTTHGIIALVRPGMLVVGGNVSSVGRMKDRLDAGASGFATTDFGRQILRVYGHGAQVLVAVNLQQIASMAERKAEEGAHATKAAGPAPFLRESGLGDVKYLIATHSDVSGQTENRALLAFGGDRRGIASWLAAPAPMGSLEFVSADAGAALSVVTKQPERMFDDVFGIVEQQNPKAREGLALADALLGLDIRKDIAGALGGEMTIALDGPVLPKPSWKLIVEVNDPARLQKSIDTMIAHYNQARQQAAAPPPQRKGSLPPPLALTQQQQNGRTFYTLQLQHPGILSEIVYTFADGYMIAAPSRALVMTALAIHANGTSLASSGAFRALLPRDSHANFSGLAYQNLGPLLGPIASQFDSKDEALFQRLAADAKPSAICAYGEADRIEVASTSSLLDLQPNAFALLNLLGVAHRGTSRRPNP
jgi:hypothetical protein